MFAFQKEIPDGRLSNSMTPLEEHYFRGWTT